MTASVPVECNLQLGFGRSRIGQSGLKLPSASYTDAFKYPGTLDCEEKFALIIIQGLT